MITESSIVIDGQPADVWLIYVDVERWPDWTASVTRVVALDGPAIEVGRRFEIKQPRLPTLVWEVTAVDPGSSWTWRQRSPGGTTFASHELEAHDGGTLVRQRIDQRGPVGVLVGVLMRRLTRRYLALESAGLKARSEQHRQGASPA
ncbi:MAG: SRPBCC family protein [Actinomycetota bacterium]|nr:SRPBCC family protein [Acidimicrobiia bacterium]MDQ3293591.1 SRPBCC family protein [Actinomycetota bacterium]